MCSLSYADGGAEPKEVCGTTDWIGGTTAKTKGWGGLVNAGEWNEILWEYYFMKEGQMLSMCALKICWTIGFEGQTGMESRSILA
jgi:hypothetical protein